VEPTSKDDVKLFSLIVVHVRSPARDATPVFHGEAETAAASLARQLFRRVACQAKTASRSLGEGECLLAAEWSGLVSEAFAAWWVFGVVVLMLLLLCFAIGFVGTKIGFRVVLKSFRYNEAHLSGRRALPSHSFPPFR
jgi:hypothetical protein